MAAAFEFVYLWIVHFVFCIVLEHHVYSLKVFLVIMRVVWDIAYVQMSLIYCQTNRRLAQNFGCDAGAVLLQDI